MRTSPSWAVALAATLALLPSTRGADEALKSGPQSGQLVPGPFHPYNVNGAHADRPHCLVCEFGLHPVVAVFARDLPEADKPLGRLLKRLDELVGQHRKEELRAFAVLLTEEAGDVDKRQALAAKLKELIKALELKNLIVSLDAPDGPPATTSARTPT